MGDRREFLKTLAKGVTYAAPVIYTLSTPRPLMAIVTSRMMLFDVQESFSGQLQESSTAPWSSVDLPDAPWTDPAPWERSFPGDVSEPPEDDD